MYTGTLESIYTVKPIQIVFEKYPTFNPIIRSIQTWECTSRSTFVFFETIEYILKSSREIYFLASYLGHEYLSSIHYNVIITFRIHEITFNERMYYQLNEVI